MKGNSSKSAKLKAYVAARESLVEKEKRFEKESKDLQARLKESERALKQKKEELKKLKDALKLKQQEGTSTKENADTKISDLENELKAKDEEIKSLKESFEDERNQLRKAKHAAEETKRNAVRSLKKERQEKAETKLLMEEERIKAEKFNSRLRKVQQEKQGAEQALRDMRSSKTDFEEKISSLEKDNQELQEGKKLAEEKLDKVSIELKNSQEEGEKLKEELMQEVELLTNKLDEMSEIENEAMQKKIESLTNQIESQKQEWLEEKEKLCNQIEEQKYELETKDTRVEELVQNLRKKETDSVSSEVSLREKFEQLNSNYQITKDKLDKIEKALEYRNISIEFLLTNKEPQKEEHKEARRVSKNSRKEPIKGTGIVVKPTVRSKQSNSAKVTKDAASSNADSKGDSKETSNLTLKTKKEEKKVRRSNSDFQKQQKAKLESKDSKPESVDEEKCIFPRVKGAHDEIKNKDDKSSKPKKRNIQKSKSNEKTHPEHRKTKKENSQISKSDERHEDDKKRLFSHQRVTKRIPTPKLTKKKKIKASQVAPATVAKSPEENANKSSQKEKSKTTSTSETPKIRISSTVNVADSKSRSTRHNRAETVPRRRSKSVPRDGNQRNSKTKTKDMKTMSKLDLGMRPTDLAPETSPMSEHDFDGDFDSFLYPRPENGWRTREEMEPQQSPQETFSKKLFASETVLENAKRSRLRSNHDASKRKGESIRKNAESVINALG